MPSNQLSRYAARSARSSLASHRNGARADAAHCLDAEVEGCRIPPATVVHDEREPTASQALNHASLVPECGHILGALDDRHDLGNTKIGQRKKILKFLVHGSFELPTRCSEPNCELVGVPA
jgi:hypothetical protein